MWPKIRDTDFCWKKGLNQPWLLPNNPCFFFIKEISWKIHEIHYLSKNLKAWFNQHAKQCSYAILTLRAVLFFRDLDSWALLENITKVSYLSTYMYDNKKWKNCHFKFYIIVLYFSKAILMRIYKLSNRFSFILGIY